MTNYSGIWPIVGLIGLVALPSFLIAVLWGTTWLVRRSRFVCWKYAIGAGTASLMLLIAGILVLFLWPISPDTHQQAALFGDDAGIKVFGGLALTLSGVAALATSFITWGICELARWIRKCAV